MDDSAITCNEVIESCNGVTKTPKRFNEIKSNFKIENFYILLAFFINYHSIIDSC